MISRTDSPKTLVVEDDEEIGSLIALTLNGHDFAARVCADGSEALALAEREHPDAVILDLALPRLSGLEVCTSLRRWFRGPILVLSGFHDEATVVEALKLGADGYVKKPFRPKELVARLRALTRRKPLADPRPDRFDVGDLSVDLKQHRVLQEGRDLRLTRTEFGILALLASNLDRVVTVDSILSHIWGKHHGDYAQSVRVHIGHIRKKIEPDPAAPRLLLTEPGVGYRLRGAGPP